MGISAVIIDDEERGRRALAGLIAEHFPHVTVVGEANGVASGLELVANVGPTMIFLDIELGDRTGFDLLDALGADRPYIVFTTAHISYALRAIRCSALDYLMKPIDPVELGAAIGKAMDATKTQQSPEQFMTLLKNLKQPGSAIERIAFPIAEGLVMVDVKDIMYCEGDGHYTTINLLGKKPFVIGRNIGQVEELLDSEQFVRVHHAHIVSIRHVTKYLRGDGGEVVMADGANLTVSKRKKQVLMDRLSKV